MSMPARKADEPVTYTAVCERVGGWWEITVPELDEMTQARHLDDVPSTVADLVALMTGTDPGNVEVDVQAHAQPSSRQPTGLLAVLRRLIGTKRD